MNRSKVIRKFVAFLLLVVFVISITPENFFHVALAHHEDSPSCTDGMDAAAHFHQKKAECHFDHPVVTASYLFEPVTLVFSLAVFNPGHTSPFLHSYKQPLFACTESRGPPQA